MPSKFNRLIDALSRILKTDRRLDEIRINQGRILAELQQAAPRTHLWQYEFKVFSQWGEDGILQFLTSNLEIEHQTFIEFGVEDFFESNCRFLMMKDHWHGYVIDGSVANVERLRAAYFYWQNPLRCKASFITRENVNSLLSESGFDKKLGILSVDIDGVDYHVLEALESWRPAILIVEYNGVFGRQRAVTVPYDAEFHRSLKHHSNLYYGANLPAFVYLTQARGYSLVGVNGVGSNAFFVRDDLLNGRVKAVSLHECYRDSTFREGRDARGQLSFLAGPERRSPIVSLPLLDVVTGQLLRVGDLVD